MERAARELCSSSTAHRRLQEWEAGGLFQQLWEAGLMEYGAANGPNPTDRGKSRTKRSLLTDGQGIPPAVVAAGANRHDMRLLAATLDGVVVLRPEPSEDARLPIPPLPVPDADETAPDVLAGVASVALFVQRAEVSAPGFQLTTSNARAVAELCRRLDGLPLALELAAARVRLLPPSLLLRRLEDCMEVLVDGPEDLPEHQRTMRSTLAWSYGLLSAGEQALLRRLSVFSGGAPAEAIETVCQAAGPLPQRSSPA